MNNSVTLSLEHGIGLITLNRPASLNTVNGDMLAALSAAYQHCDDDDDIRVVVVTGSGRAFCAGADLSDGTAFDSRKHGEISSCPLTMQAWEVRKPVIAACNGHAIGVGLGIAAQCDMRIVAAEGQYGFLQNRRGVVADFGMDYTLPRLVGFERAFELLVRAPRLSGQEACDWGLASRVRPAHEVLQCAMEIARDMAEHCSPLVMGLHKRLLWQGLDQRIGESVAAESRALNHSMQLPDALEGGMAYIEKRQPQWQSSISRDWPETF